jgi:hypothetical protein
MTRHRWWGIVAVAVYVALLVAAVIVQPWTEGDGWPPPPETWAEP